MNRDVAFLLVISGSLVLFSMAMRGLYWKIRYKVVEGMAKKYIVLLDQAEREMFCREEFKGDSCTEASLSPSGCLKCKIRALVEPIRAFQAKEDQRKN